MSSLYREVFVKGGDNDQMQIQCQDLERLFDSRQGYYKVLSFCFMHVTPNIRDDLTFTYTKRTTTIVPVYSNNPVYVWNPVIDDWEPTGAHWVDHYDTVNTDVNCYGTIKRGNYNHFSLATAISNCLRSPSGVNGNGNLPAATCYVDSGTSSYKVYTGSHTISIRFDNQGLFTQLTGLGRSGDNNPDATQFAKFYLSGCAIDLWPYKFVSLHSDIGAPNLDNHKVESFVCTKGNTEITCPLRVGFGDMFYYDGHGSASKPCTVKSSYRMQLLLNDQTKSQLPPGSSWCVTIAFSDGPIA